MGEGSTAAPGPGQKLWEEMLILRTQPRSHPWAGLQFSTIAPVWLFVEGPGQRPRVPES